MNKYLAIFFLHVYALGATPIGQICKLPTLVEHFQKHQNENKGLSILSFLKMHYFNGDPIDADHEEDMKLPFKTIDFNTSISISSITDIHIFTREKQDFLQQKIVKNPQTENWYANTYLDTIWQPPRLS